MKAIILSAGQGRRLLPLTESVPKCCLSVNGKKMLEWQVDALTAAGIEEVVVVTGFAHHVVQDAVSQVTAVPVRCLYNPFFALSDNLGTCWVARGDMNGPFVLINGDTLFEPTVLERLLQAPHAHPITLASDRKDAYDEDDMKIISRGERLERVGKKLDLEHVNGESIGMMVFNEAGARLFVNKVERLMSGADGLARWYLSAIDELAIEGEVGIRSIHGLGWCEVDDHDDLALAARRVGTWNYGSATDVFGFVPPIHQPRERDPS